MAFSLQSFPSTVANFLTKTLENDDQSRRASCCTSRSHNGSKAASSSAHPIRMCLCMCNTSSPLFSCLETKHRPSSVPRSLFKHLKAPPRSQTLFQLLFSYSIDETNEDNTGILSQLISPPCID